jgi:hypothetical protein
MFKGVSSSDSDEDHHIVIRKLLQYTVETKTTIPESPLNTHDFSSIRLPTQGIVGPANQNGCIILCVGNLTDEKF